MFIIVPKQRQQAPPAQPADADPTGSADPSATATAAAEEDDRGPVRTATACDSCRVRKTKCNGQRPCGPCRRKHIICVFSRPKDRNAPVTPAQAALLQHQQRRLRTAVQHMASIIAKHETGAEKDPSSIDVLEQLDRYAPTEIIDDEESDPEAAANNTLQPSETATRPAKARKRQRKDDTIPSANSSEMDTSTAPMFDIMPNPHFANTGSRTPVSNEAYDTMLQFMQSMQNRSGAPNTTTAQQATNMPQSGVPFAANNTVQPSTMGTDNVIPPASFQPNMSPFDFTSLIDWETSLANFQNEQLFTDETWNDDMAMDTHAGLGAGNPGYTTSSTGSFHNM